VQRRDLTAGQRAIVAARALPMFEDAADKRKKSGTSVPDRDKGRSTKQAATQFKVGWNAVSQAKALLANAADLAERVSLATPATGPWHRVE
jgi:hypothetical protein